VEWLRGSGTVSIRRDRHATGPYGLFGGRPAPLCRTVLAHPDGSEEEIPSKKVFTIAAGDVLKVWTTGGGGYGDPLDRSTELVLADVLDGRVSRAAAEREYGVMVVAEAVDAEATAALRARRRAERPDQPRPYFDRGPEPVMAEAAR